MITCAGCGGTVPLSLAQIEENIVGDIRMFCRISGGRPVDKNYCHNLTAAERQGLKAFLLSKGFKDEDGELVLPPRKHHKYGEVLIVVIGEHSVKVDEMCA